MSHVPSAWVFVLLGLAAFRTWKLLAEDTILDWPRERLIRGEKMQELWGCPWCLGFWLTLAWWVAWEIWPHATLLLTAPFALSALVGAVAVTLNALVGES